MRKIIGLLVYVIDKENNKITTISTSYLQEFLLSNPELLAQYNAEAEPENKDCYPIPKFSIVNAKFSELIL